MVTRGRFPMKRRRVPSCLDREVERVVTWTSVLKTTVLAAEALRTTMFEFARRAVEVSFLKISSSDSGRYLDACLRDKVKLQRAHGGCLGDERR